MQSGSSHLCSEEKWPKTPSKRLSRGQGLPSHHAVVEDGWSFPNGHATAAVALYGFLIYATWKFAPAPWRMPLTLLFSAIILLVGFSRAYLGVHYASDVIGGFAVGAFSCGSASCWEAFERGRRRAGDSLVASQR